MIAVRLAGSRALDALSSGRGKVLAVFRRSIYLERTDGALACLGPSGMGAGPLNALCDLPEGFDWEARGLAPGAPCACERGVVRLAGNFFFTLEGAETWRPAALPSGWTAEALAEGLHALARTARPPEEGMGRWIGRALANISPFHAAAGSGARALDAWLAGALRGDAPAPPQEAKNLIGFGPGLTPSGDDYLGGAMIALRALGEAGAADRLAAWAVPLARERTGKISLAHLACAAEGQGASALHGALAILATPGAPGLAEALASVHAVGHTSGWDALAGAAAACGAWTRVRTRAAFEERPPARV